jgi:hypothetical protein
MAEDSLRELVARLRSELSQPHDLDEPSRRALHDLAQELEAAVHRPSEATPHTVLALRERLADRVRELEASHPKVAATLGNIIDTLAFYGL